MKKLLACLLLVGGVSLFVAGCKPEKTTMETTVEKAVEKPAAEHPTTEHPAKTEDPKDHPAH